MLLMISITTVALIVLAVVVASADSKDDNK